MPTYDYQCDSCGHIVEIMQSFRDKPLKKCPECNKNDMQQLITGGAGLVFKGSGFYVTDNTSKSSTEKTSSKTQKVS